MNIEFLIMNSQVSSSNDLALNIDYWRLGIQKKGEEKKIKQF